MTSPTASSNGVDPRLSTVAEIAGTVHTAVDRVEDTTVLDRAVAVLRPFARRLAASPAGPVLRGDWLGHALHPMLTDVPIGCWTSSFALDLLGGTSGRKASTRLIGLGLLAAVPTAASGAAEWSDVDAEAPSRVGVAHAAANTMAVVLYLGSWRARHRGHHYRGVLLGFGGALVASVGGHLGGHLAFALGIGSGERGRPGDGPGKWPAPTSATTAR
jgi:uncharacterized membrane protein